MEMPLYVQALGFLCVCFWGFFGAVVLYHGLTDEEVKKDEKRK